MDNTHYYAKTATKITHLREKIKQTINFLSKCLENRQKHLIFASQIDENRLGCHRNSRH